MIVLDVSAAVAMARGTEEGMALRSLLLQDEAVIAPRLFLTEMANVAWQYARAGQLSEEDSLALFQLCSDIVDNFAEVESLLVEAIHEAIRNNHPVYDMLYLVLARRNAATLFTFDKMLRTVCRANGVGCVELERL